MQHDASPQVADRWSVGRLLSWTAEFLKKKGSESPRLDAEVLLAFALGWDRVKLYTRYDNEVGEPPRAAFRDLVKRRADGAPVAYLVGKKEFFSLTLTVNASVLIPRPDSEFVVVEFLAAFKGVDGPRIVDVGTGSGCLALACIQNHKTATALAIDISSVALLVAERNAECLGLSGRVSFREGNLLQSIKDDGPFDAILSNPPYIKSEVVPRLERSVSAFEPHLALDGGLDGLRVVAPLIQQAVSLLKVGGILLLEIGSDQEADVRALLAAEPELDLSPTVRDHANHPRVLKAVKKSC